MIKHVIFDLDGVLLDAKKIHFDALNESLPEGYEISMEEHLSTYDGRKTRDKLDILTEKKGLPRRLHEEIYRKKQAITIKKISSITENDDLIHLFKKLRVDGYKISVCSNSIRNTTLEAIERLKLRDYCECLYSNQDVTFPKPHPEMFWMVMIRHGLVPDEVLIVEDSPVGLLAAERSGAHVMRVKDPSEVNIENVYANLHGKKVPARWKQEDLTIVVPMAGLGSRFKDAGFTFPKPLIEVNGRPMIDLVVENIGIDARYVFIVQKEHVEKYNIIPMLKIISPKCEVVVIDGVTDGAARTVLKAAKLYNNHRPLIIVNSDQFIEWSPAEFMYHVQESGVDGCILTFKSNHPKWSYVKKDEDGFVTEVAEKNPISDEATVGLYYWKSGSDFVDSAYQMIDAEDKVNDEYYVCPVYKYAIKDGDKISTFPAKRMWGLGTPEDLDYFVRNYKE